MKTITVTHLSKTPLVGAPGRIAKYVNLQPGFKAIHIFFQDYPNHLKNYFTRNSQIWNKSDKFQEKFLTETLEKSDIFHIHNDLDEEFQKTLLSVNRGAKKIYQVHSVKREGPLYADISDSFLFPFHEKCVINQLHPRLYNNFRAVPNIVDRQPPRLIHNEKKFRILFCPTHKQGSRYATKYSPQTPEILERLTKSGFFEIIQPPYLAPEMLAEIRRKADFVIDEIATGGFHQVSLEALSAGAIAINNADYLATDFYAKSLGIPERPPFFKASDQDLYDKLLALGQEPQKVAELQIASHDYFLKYLLPDRLAQVYTNMYSEVLANEQARRAD